MINYNKKPFKRGYQKFFFNRSVIKTTFMGLCGPNPKGYLRNIYNAGFKHIILVDRDKTNLEKYSELIKIYKKKGIVLLFVNEDINNLLYLENTFYDLDYCSNINTISKFLPKISKLKEFTLTVSIRGKGAGEDEVLDKLFALNRKFYQRRYRGSLDTQLMMMFYFPPKKLKN